MILNGHFALKSDPSSASDGLAYWLSDKTVRKYAETHIRSAAKKCSPARDCTGDIGVMELFTGITEQEASNQLYLWFYTHSSHTTHMLFTGL